MATPNLALRRRELKQLKSDVGAGFSVGKGVVMVEQVKTAIGGDGVQPVVGQVPQQALGGDAGTVELVIGISHLVATEDSLQTTLVEGLVVSDQGKSLDEGFNLRPHIGENGGVVGILMTQAMDALTPITVIVGLGLDKRIERVHNLPITHNDDTNRADAGALGVSGFEVDSGEVLHFLY